MIAAIHPENVIPDPDNRFEGLPIQVQYIDGRDWLVVDDVSYRLTQGRLAGYTSTVRAGFKTDFASVPRVFWRLCPPTGLSNRPYGIPAVFHDWLYAHQRVQGIPIRRETADRLFLEIMLYVGISRTRASIMYRAVRIGGWLGWRRNRNPRPTKPEQRHPGDMEFCCAH